MMCEVAKVEVPYVNGYKDRHGRQRYYYRRKGFKAIPLRGEPGSIEFARSYEQAEGSAKPAGTREGPRSIGALIDRYFLSLDFRNLTPVTQKGHRSVLEAFREAHGHRDVDMTSAGNMSEVFQDYGNCGISTA